MVETLDNLRQQENAGPAFGGRPPITNLYAALEAASDLTADQAARVSRLAREIGVTEELVLASPERAEKIAVVNRIQAYPLLAKWAGQSRVNAALTRDEPEALGGILDSLKGMAGGLASFVPKAFFGANKLVTDVAGAGFGAVEAGLDSIGADTPAGWAGEARKFFQSGSQASLEQLQNPLWNARPGLAWYHPEKLVYDAVDGLASMVPSVATMAATGGASAAPTAAAAGRTILAKMLPRAGLGGVVGGAQEGAALYTGLSAEAGADDRNLENLVAGALMTMGSGLLNAVSFGKIFEALPPGLRRQAMDVLQTGLTEGVTEQAENPLRALLSGLARGDGAEKIIQDVWAASTDLSELPGAVLAGGGMRAAAVAMDGRQEQPFVEHQLAVNAKVTASGLYQRSPEKMRDLLESAEPMMSRPVTLPRARLSAETLKALKMGGETGETISVPLSELHARLTPEGFKETISLADRWGAGYIWQDAAPALETATGNAEEQNEARVSTEKPMVRSDHPYGWSGPDVEISPMDMAATSPLRWRADTGEEISFPDILVRNQRGRLSVRATNSAVRKNSAGILASFNLPMVEVMDGLRAILPDHGQTGWRATIGRHDLVHIASFAKNEDAFLAMQAAPELWRTSRYVGTENWRPKGDDNVRVDKDQNPDLLASHTFVNEININGRAYDVKIKVRQTLSGRNYYSQQLIKKESPEVDQAVPNQYRSGLYSRPVILPGSE